MSAWGPQAPYFVRFRPVAKTATLAEGRATLRPRQFV
jgi:hypothetical protein